MNMNLGAGLNVVFSCSSIDYLSSDIVTRKLGLGINMHPFPQLNRGDGYYN